MYAIVLAQVYAEWNRQNSDARAATTPHQMDSIAQVRLMFADGCTDQVKTNESTGDKVWDC